MISREQHLRQDLHILDIQNEVFTKHDDPDVEIMAELEMVLHKSEEIEQELRCMAEGISVTNKVHQLRQDRYIIDIQSQTFSKYEDPDDEMLIEWERLEDVDIDLRDMLRCLVRISQ